MKHAKNKPYTTKKVTMAPTKQSKSKCGFAVKTTSINLNRFRPLVPLARMKVNELIARGARLISVDEGLVRLVRMGQYAQIDDFGRVQWNT